MEDVEYLKLKYNYYLKRIKKADSYLRNCSKENYKKYYPTELTYCDSIEDTLTGADLCLIFTEWKQIKEMDVTAFEKHMKRAIVLDGRNCFDLKAFRNTHVLYESIGRPVQDYLYMEEAR